VTKELSDVLTGSCKDKKAASFSGDEKRKLMTKVNFSCCDCPRSKGHESGHAYKLVVTTVAASFFLSARTFCSELFRIAWFGLVWFGWLVGWLGNRSSYAVGSTPLVWFGGLFF
jgi:hypothetical protein